MSPVNRKRRLLPWPKPAVARSIRWLAAALPGVLLPAALLPWPARAAELPTATVRASIENATWGADGVVEAVRQSSIASEVSGTVTALPVKAGDRVSAGQVLVRIDERAAAQQAAANEAQAAAAEAELQAAQKEFERARHLFEEHYISQAALDQAEAQFKAARAEARARLAQAGAATTQTSLHTLRAPYGGVLASVDVQVGDMATPGRALITMYDPAALRVVVTVPESVVQQLRRDAEVRIEVPGADRSVRQLTARSVTLLPAADPESHTMRVRLGLPSDAGQAAPVPGMFARAWLPASAQPTSHLMIPARAVIRRTELQAVYVVDQAGKPWLRQVRLGRAMGDQVEILAGLEPGERVALDPLAAAR
jgi:RND family efflux transporter MFP subunit